MGKDLPASGTKANFDLKPEFTFEELFAELETTYQEKMNREPSKEDGWFTITDYANNPPGMNYEVARRKLREMVAVGMLEVKKYRGKNYYRRLADADPDRS